MSETERPATSRRRADALGRTLAGAIVVGGALLGVPLAVEAARAIATVAISLLAGH